MKDVYHWSEAFRMVLRKLVRLSQRSAELLAPVSECCAVCGKAKSGSPSGPGVLPDGTTSSLLRRSLCGSCMRAIPWLTAIACPVCGRSIRCEDCGRRSSRPFVMNRSAVAYDAQMRDWLALYKYRGQERLGPVLAEMMLPACRALARHLRGDAWDAITYVPISEERAMERGFNQAERMARYLSEAEGIPLARLLRRTRHAEKMSFKTRRERLRDAETLFAGYPEGWRELRHRIGPGGAAVRLLLVDDIYTTGSTATACAKALREAGGEAVAVYVLTWARS